MKKNNKSQLNEIHTFIQQTRPKRNEIGKKVAANRKTYHHLRKICELMCKKQEIYEPCEK